VENYETTQSPGTDLNSEPPEYKRALTTGPVFLNCRSTDRHQSFSSEIIRAGQIHRHDTIVSVDCYKIGKAGKMYVKSSFCLAYPYKL
jgi:hypothetical protein